MSNHQEVRTDYKSYLIRYDETADQWNVYEDNERVGEATSLALARKVADKHLSKLKAQVLRVPVLVNKGRYGRNKYVKGEATSYVGGYSREVWVTVDGSRRKEPGKDVLLDTPENVALLAEQAELETRLHAISTKFRSITAEDFVAKGEKL